MPTPVEQIALRFNSAINRHNLEALVELMTEDHLFVDPAGSHTRGKAAVHAAWKGFFKAFPDYCNVFASSQAEGDVVLFRGRSECAEPDLAGPAVWRAVIRGDMVAEWHVYDDTPEIRGSLGLVDAGV